MNLARSYVNDTFMGVTGTPGEGQIFTDNAAFTIPFLRAVTAELYQELGNTGAGVVIRDNFILFNVPVVCSPTWGFGIPDPSVQVYLSYAGYFDGVQIHPEAALPPNLLVPIFLRERTAGTNNEFEEMHECQNGLGAARQTTAQAFWEWRSDKIWMPGSTLPKDIWIRYVAVLPLIAQPVPRLQDVSVPISDCENSLALKLAKYYGLPRGSDQVPLCITLEQQATYLIKNRFVRALQAIDFRGEAFGEARLNLFPLDRYR
jgi:hypothetical protein